MGDQYPKAKVGVVQAAPVFLNREASVEKAVSFIDEAGRLGLDLLVFPESFIPGHPLWYHFFPATSVHSLRMATELFKNSVTIPGPETEVLCAAARRNNVIVVMGLCEKRPHTTGTLYNTQLFIDRDGTILGKHQKLTPTVGERLVHTGGFGDTLRVFDTHIGRLGGLICGENANPLALFALSAQGIQIHAASWPNHFSSLKGRMAEAILFNTRSLAYKCCCFVLNACGTISEEMRSLFSEAREKQELLADPENGGGSSIIAPDGSVIAGPMSGKEEGILTADIDLEACVRAKIVHDFAGHYNRPDVFTLHVNQSVPSLARFQNGDGGEPSPTAPRVVEQLHDAE